MSKPKTNREQRLLVLLPAALVLAGYSFFLAIPKQRDLQNALGEVESLRRTAIPPEAAEQSKILLSNAVKKLDTDRQRIASNRNRIREIAMSWRADDSQLQSVQQITKSMEQYNLSIVNQDNESQPVLSEYFTNLCEIMDAQCADRPLQFWQVEVEGRYFDLTNFLASIDLYQMKTIPISISMTSSTANDGLHSWKIVFMI